MRSTVLLTLSLGLTLLACGSAQRALAQDVKPQPAVKGGAQEGGVRPAPPDPYPLDTCAVSGKKLGEGASFLHQHEGRELRFCSTGCIAKFQEGSARYLARIDASIIEQQRPIYPLTTCLVSGEPLSGDGSAPVDRVFGNRLVRICGKACMETFDKNPAQHLARLDEAVIAAQGKNYPLEICPISGEPLGSMGKPVDLVVGGRLVRLCCAGCKKTLFSNPLAALAQIQAAEKKSARGKPEANGKPEADGKPETDGKPEKGSQSEDGKKGG